jgi:DNA-binding NarL/FixJ family response regulator
MKYRNANDVLPDDLLKEVQKYAAGESLYIPKSRERMKWGEASGARTFFQQRNEEIRQKYVQKMSIENIADEYCLSFDTVRKILFT